jgi:hypothetical protein
MHDLIKALVIVTAAVAMSLLLWTFYGVTDPTIWDDLLAMTGVLAAALVATRLAVWRR